MPKSLKISNGWMEKIIDSIPPEMREDFNKSSEDFTAEALCKLIRWQVAFLTQDESFSICPVERARFVEGMDLLIATTRGLKYYKALFTVRRDTLAAVGLAIDAEAPEDITYLIRGLLNA